MEEAIIGYCRALHAAGRSAGTERSYGYLLAQWGRWLTANNTTWQQVTPAQLESFIENYAAQHSRSTTALMVTCLKSFYQWAARRGHVPSSPAALLPVVHRDRPLPRALPRWQVVQLLERLDEPGQDAERWQRDRLLVRCYLYTGLRLSELAKLNKDAIDIDARMLRVRGKGGQERFVPIHADLVDDLTAALQHSGPLFPSRRGGPLTAAGISEMFRRYVHEQLQVDCTAHQLRHTFATELRRRRRDLREIQQLLGHRKLDTTAIYTAVYPDDLNAAVAVLGWR